MEIATFKVGERRVRDGVSYELRDDAGIRIGMLRVAVSDGMAAKLVQANRIVVEAGPR